MGLPVAKSQANGLVASSPRYEGTALGEDSKTFFDQMSQKIQKLWEKTLTSISSGLAIFGLACLALILVMNLIGIIFAMIKHPFQRAAIDVALVLPRLLYNIARFFLIQFGFIQIGNHENEVPLFEM